MPIELIEAAGLLPLRITGYPAPLPQVLEERLFALLPKGFWQVRQSSLEFLNHSFGRLVDGTYSMLDALVIPNTRKPLLNMYGQLRAAQQTFPELRLPHLIVLDRAAAPVDSAHAFNRESVVKFRTDLESWLGTPIADAAIGEALALRRENARSLREILSWRRAIPAGISGTDVLSLIGAAMFMDARSYAARIREVAKLGPTARDEAHMRVFIGGSPPDNPQLYSIVESLGATIVGEDHCWGERYVDFASDDTGDPMSILERRWDCSAACGFRLPFKATTENVVRRARAVQADAVLLNVFRHDEMQIWDTPGQIAALRETRLPVLHLSEQPHVIEQPDALRARIGAFLDSVRAQGTVAS